VSDNNTIRYKPGRNRKPEDRTDWARVHALTDEEIETAAAADPDNLPLTDDQLDRAQFGRRVRRLRDRLGFSQSAFAERFRFPVASLRDWEQGRRIPDAATKAYLTVIEREPEAVLRALSPGEAA
jgi:putative transcriptional regulator